MNRRGLLVRVLGLAAVGGAAWWARDNLLWPDPDLVFGPEGATPWTPHVRPANVPTTSVMVDGVQTTALIDSGAQYSVIDRRLYAQLPPHDRPLFDVPLVAYGVGGQSQMGRGVTLNVSLAGLEIRKLRAAILDLGPLASEDGLATPLILGQDVLGQAVLALDSETTPGRRHARLISHEAFVKPPDLVATAVRRAAGGLHAEVSIEGSAIEAIIDTGASTLLTLDRATAQQVGLLDGRPSEIGTSLVLGGERQATVVEARTITFADQLYRRARVGVVDQPPLPNFPGGLVGMAAFRGKRAALDLGRGALYVSRELDLTVGPLA